LAKQIDKPSCGINVTYMTDVSINRGVLGSVTGAWQLERNLSTGSPGGCDCEHYNWSSNPLERRKLLRTWQW